MTALSLLDVQNLSVEFRTRSGIVKALENVSFQVAKGETVAIVGESGSGKSVTAYTILGINEDAARVTGGTAIFQGLDLLTANERTLMELRGREISMIFQNPRAALNPIRPVGKQIADVLRRHASVPAREAPDRAIDLLAQVKIPDPKRRAQAYPFELSGGMCQRIMIALALACSPSLLIADEPTTGLDVTTQAVIMDLIAELAQARGMAAIWITHDLGLAADYCDRIVVMHAGHVVESAPTEALFAAPRHPYTKRLIGATPHEDTALAALESIPGGLPDLRAPLLPPCRFSQRCDRYDVACDAPVLPLVAVAQGHLVACRHPL